MTTIVLLAVITVIIASTIAFGHYLNGLPSVRWGDTTPDYLSKKAKGPRRKYRSRAPSE